MQTERVTFLTTPEAKRALDAFAAQRGESVGNVVREATQRYMAGPPSGDEEAALKLLLEEINQAVPKMRASLESSIASLAEARGYVQAKMREAGLWE